MKNKQELKALYIKQYQDHLMKILKNSERIALQQKQVVTNSKGIRCFIKRKAA